MMDKKTLTIHKIIVAILLINVLLLILLVTRILVSDIMAELDPDNTNFNTMAKPLYIALSVTLFLIVGLVIVMRKNLPGLAKYLTFFIVFLSGFSWLLLADNMKLTVLWNSQDPRKMKPVAPYRGEFESINALWGTPDGKAYAVGNTVYGSILHFDGTRWRNKYMRKERAPYLNAIWGTSGSNIYAVGQALKGRAGQDYGNIFHFDGSVWKLVDDNFKGPLNCIWGASENDIFVAGNGGVILHFDGTWKEMKSGVTADFSGIWGSAGNDVYAIGCETGSDNQPADDIILHYNGSTWNTVVRDKTHSFGHIWGISKENMYIAAGLYQDRDGKESEGILFHFDGKTLKPVFKSKGSLKAVWGTSPTDIYTGGEGYYVHHFNGKSWQQIEIRGVYDIKQIRGTSKQNIYLVGESGLYHFDGKTWTRIEK